MGDVPQLWVLVLVRHLGGKVHRLGESGVESIGNRFHGAKYRHRRAETERLIPAGFGLCSTGALHSSRMLYSRKCWDGESCSRNSVTSDISPILIRRFRGPWRMSSSGMRSVRRSPAVSSNLRLKRSMNSQP